MLLDHYVLRDVPVTEWKKWDHFIDNHPAGHLLQSWGWGELKASIGWYPFRFSLWDQHLGQMVAAAQVLCRTIPTFPLWAGHLAYIPKGPVIDWSDPSLCQAFFTRLNTQMRRQGALALRLEPNRLVNAVTNIPTVTSSTVNKPLSLYPVSPVQPVRSIVLNLLPTEDVLLAGMKEKWRYNLRLAERKGVSVREALTVEDIQAWYTLNYLLQWEAIRWAKQQGAVQYDFWGIPETDSEDEVMAGVHRFKRGWGGEQVRFVGCYEHTYRPLTMRVARKMLPAWLE